MKIPKVVPNRASPAGFIVEEAERQNKSLKHENLGFLSRSHGFMPIKPPLLSFPKTHEVWDEIAAQLSYWYRRVQLRYELERIPLLNASETFLADEYLFRASSFLCILLQAYYRAEVGEPEHVPEAIMKPLQQVSQRLGRTEIGITINDLMTYNWRLKDPAKDERTVENMNLLFDVYDTSEDAIFNLTITEIVYQSTPLVTSVIKLQEAMLKYDDTAIEKELLSLANMMNAMSRALQKINLLTYSPYRFNPMVWARTAGIFGLQHNSTAPGPGAVAAPFLHVLDALLGRKLYSSSLGQDEKKAIYLVASPHLKKFLGAIEMMPLGDYIANRKNTILQGTFMHFLEQYVGETGFLGIHRRKIFGFLESALKVGKNTTTARFKMQDIFFHRGWHQLNNILKNAQKERFAALPAYYPKMTCKSKISAQDKSSAIIKFDLEGTGLRYNPGDYVQILVPNDEKKIMAALHKLGLDGGMLVDLTVEWLQWLSKFEEYSHIESTLPLIDFMKMAQLSPVEKATLEKLYTLTRWSKLKEIIENREYEEWDIYEILDLLANKGSFNLSKIIHLPAWREENISKLIPPLHFKTYSVASHEIEGGRQLLTIMVSAVHFHVHHGHNIKHDGVASVQLVEDVKAGDQFYMKLINNIQFRLPHTPSSIILFAASSGIAPFRGFFSQMINQKLSHKCYLFISEKNCDVVWYKREIEYWLNHTDLSFFMTSTQEDFIYSVKEENGKKILVKQASKRKRIDALIKEESNRKLLSGLQAPTAVGKERGYFYICGRAGFAQTIQEALTDIVEKAIDKENFIPKLAGQNRYHTSVFTTHVYDKDMAIEFDPSEVVLHNNKQTGYWIVVNRGVYDITDYMDLHPGGPVILRNQTGLDATQEYEAIGHHLDGGINSLLSNFFIGNMRKINFGHNNGGVAFLNNQYTYISLEEFYSTWIADLYLVVEMYNTVLNMFNHYDVITSSWKDTQEELIFYRMQSTANDHANFMCTYFSCIISRLTSLWSLTASIGYTDKDIFHLRDEFDKIKNDKEYRKNSAFDALLLNRIRATDYNLAALKEYNRNYTVMLDQIIKNDIQFIESIKSELREGAILFEKFSAKVIENAGNNLLMHLNNTVKLTQCYLSDMEILYDKMMDIPPFPGLEVV